jgi:hypothetical protein
MRSVPVNLNMMVTQELDRKLRQSTARRKQQLTSFMCGSKEGTSPPEKLKNHTSIKDQRSLRKDFIQLFLFLFFFAREYFLSTRVREEGLRFAEAL